MATGYIMLDTPNTAQPQGTLPRRGGAKPSGTAIIHTSEGDWRRGVAALTRLVQTRADFGCYHVGVDWADLAWYYPWIWECWQDTETNNWAVGISAACKTTDWGNMPADVEEGFYRNLAKAAANFVVYMRETYNITVPLRRITGAEARARVPGFCAHGDSGIARSDPGARFDWKRFFQYTQEELASGVINPQGNMEEDDMYTEADRARDNRILQIAEAVDIRTGNEEQGNLAILAKVLRERINYAVFPDGTPMKIAVQGDIDTILRAVAGVGSGAVDVGRLAELLKANLAPDVADELAKRLAS